MGESDRLQKLHRQIIAASLAAIPDDSCLGAIPRHFSDDAHAPAPLDALATSRRAVMVSRPAQTIFVEADTLVDWLNVCSHIYDTPQSNSCESRCASRSVMAPIGRLAYV